MHLRPFSEWVLVWLLSSSFAIRHNAVVVRSTFFLWPNHYLGVSLAYKSAAILICLETTDGVCSKLFDDVQMRAAALMCFFCNEADGSPRFERGLGLEQLTPLCARFSSGMGREHPLAYRQVHAEGGTLPVFLEQSAV